MTLLTATLNAIGTCALITAALSMLTASEPSTAQTAPSGKLLVYVGGYTKGKAKGIFVFSMNPKTGALTAIGTGPDVENASFLAIHPNHKYLYAVNETQNFEGKSSGSVSSYSIDPSTGGLTFINEKASGGADPCHLTIDSSGKCVIVANYTGGSTEVLPIGDDGSLGDPSCFVQHTGNSVDTARQEAPHAHSAIIDPTGKYVMVCDLGTDHIVVYKFDRASGAIDASGLVPGTVAPGSGPRHLVFHQDGKHLFVINEMKSTVTAFNYDSSTGSMSAYQTISTLPAGYNGSTTCAEIALSADGKFLYGSNRGHDSIAIYAVSAVDRKLTLVGIEPTGGKVPRNFAIDPSGKYLIAANQQTNNLVVFKRDAHSGKLTPTGATTAVTAPVSVVYLQQK